MKSYINGEPAKLTKLKDNYWEFNLICCDCGLTHHHHFLLDKGELWMNVFRDDYNTAFERKKKRSKNASKRRKKTKSASTQERA